MQSLFEKNVNLHLLNLDNIQYRDLKFENGESYCGGWKNSKPEGEGCYTWADGSTYEGSWHAGLKHGWGTYHWPNGAVYQGEWHEGLMQGFGTFESPDGSRYQGGWQANLKHGLGTKVYANGDVYEGLWRNGKAEGPGRYVWAVRNEYDGEWKAGKMHGQGTLKWRTGERYDGEWCEGQEDGIGVFTWADGSTYEGFWVAGRKQGAGVFRPAPNKAGPTPGEVTGRQSSQEVVSGAALAAAGAKDVPLDSPSAAQAMKHREDFQTGPEHRRNANLIFVCDYEAGRLVHEEVLSSAELESIFGPLHKQHAQAAHERKQRLARKQRRRRHEERPGETIFKGHRSYDLMLNLQLGIRYTITAGSKLPLVLEPPGPEAFEEKVWIRFPREGSEVTPPHPSTDFKWKDYCPTAFRALRALFGIDIGEYILSICGDQALRELASPGKSGSVFFLSHDDKFVIKTMRKEEIKLLLAMVPRYLEHVRANPDTLLLRFFGVHRVKPSHGNKVRFVVMNNIFRTEAELHKRYDLKGSTLGRTAGPRPPGSAILKDLDLDVSFQMDPAWRGALMRQLQADLGFLEAMHVMDYSLLLGVHYRGDGYASPLVTDKEDAGDEREGRRGAAADSDADSEEGDAARRHSAEATLSSTSSFGDGRLERQVSGGQGGVSGRVGGGDSNDLEVVRSMHSLAIERVSPSKMVERSRSSWSASLRGLSWTFKHKSREQLTEAAPAPVQQPVPTSQPANSAHVTPRQLPSLRPTPRGQRSVPLISRLGLQSSRSDGRRGGALPQNNSSRGGSSGGGALTRPLPPGDEMHMRPGLSQARQSGTAGGMNGGLAVDAAKQQQQQQQNGAQALHMEVQPAAGEGAAQTEAGHALLPPGLAASPQGEGPQQAAWAGEPTAAAELKAAPAARVAAAGQQEASAAGEESGGLISWRSDAVQLPEVTLAEMMLASPRSPHDSPTASAGAAAAAWAGHAAAAERAEQVQEPPSSGQRSARQPAAAQHQASLDVIAEEDGPDSSSGRRVGGSSSPQCTQRQEQHTQAHVPGSGQGSHPIEHAGSGSSTPRSSSQEPASPSVQAAAELSGVLGRGLPLPDGVPRINMLGWPSDPRPAPSGNWQSYVESISESLTEDGEGTSTKAAEREREGSPGSVRSKLWLLYRKDDATDRHDTHDRDQAAAETETDASGAAGAAAENRPKVTVSPVSSGRIRSLRAPPLQVPTADKEEEVRLSGSKLANGRTLTPPVVPVLADLGSGHSTDSPVAVAGDKAPAASSHPSSSAMVSLQSSPQHTPPHVTHFDSEPSAPALQAEAGAAAAGAAPETLASAAPPPLRREVSVVDLASPEATALASQVSRVLDRPRQDRLVQDLLRLARYHILGQKPGGGTRQQRTATMVLASRHMVQDKAAAEAAGGLAPVGEEEAAAAVPAAATTPTAGAAAAAAAAAALAAPQQRLGYAMPALAVGRQEPRQCDEVVLFFGVIDFLQEYNMRKKLEHSFKAVVSDARAISVVEPRAYAKRFLAFMDSVFLPREGGVGGQNGQQQQQQQSGKAHPQAVQGQQEQQQQVDGGG